jgi:hypothetical protein
VSQIVSARPSIDPREAFKHLNSALLHCSGVLHTCHTGTLFKLVRMSVLLTLSSESSPNLLKQSADLIQPGPI